MAALPVHLTEALAVYAGHPRPLVATDFDGVLAPLVDDPMSARPLPGAMETLAALAEHPGVTAALVSGRDLASLRTLSGLPDDSPVVLIGSHGAESSVDLDISAPLDHHAHDRLLAATAYVDEIVAGHPDARVERKPAGVVLHTRGIDAAQAESATAAALRIPDADPGIHAMQGKDVVELTVVPVTKGIALQALSRVASTDATLYLGDDATDEKAFDVLRTNEGHVTIKVGEGATAAQHRVLEPTDAVAVLREVLARRTA
ncbi:trehalose-phosphatase [Luteipulveratus mongoliensis]|uniref:Trehalose 6-phosphate phosphatase n=1 Tax=Luteipulveratus mongoliensis TaxID=571913 RepID=A0A0K1JGM2_9MICO|nr:trehalose-phosphatase [Luteipulveratus mongoliensis]AKU15723.1 hypothetical protein VV02_07435 [Luteipulveratus mongoliensis]